MGIFKVLNNDKLKGKQFLGFKRNDEYVEIYTYGKKLLV